MSARRRRAFCTLLFIPPPMLIAIVGTRASGKDSVHRYLVDKGFTPLALAEAEPDNVRTDPLPRSARLIDLHLPFPHPALSPQP